MITSQHLPVRAADSLEALRQYQPFISVVVPVRNEAPTIQSVLRQLATQQYDPKRFEILVADGESTDGTAEAVLAFARQYGNVRLLCNPLRWSSAGRNVGIRAARGEIVVIVDGHCELEDDQYLARLADAFARSGAHCIGRPQPLDVQGANPLQQAIAAVRSSPLGHHPRSFVYWSREGFVRAESVAAAYRREVFDAVGLFDEQFDACEDVEFNRRVDRAGLRCYFTPRVAVRYRPRDSLSGLFRQLVRYGRGRIRLARKHAGTLSLGTLLPLALVQGLVLGLPLSLVAEPFFFAYVALLAVYAAVVVAGCLAIAVRQRRFALLPRLLVVLITVHVASGVGMVLELMRPGRQAPAGKRGFRA